MNKKILVPTDFSKASQVAYFYAVELAKIYDAQIELIHVYQGSFAVDQPMVFSPGLGREETLQKQLNHFAKTIDESTEDGSIATVKTSTLLIPGATVPAIVAESENPEVFMIIMGTEGKNGMVEKILGSIASGVAQQAKCPVLMIPKSVEYKAFQHILYAANFESAEETVVDQAHQLAELFRAKMHFIHIWADEKKEDFLETEERIFNQLFKNDFPKYTFLMTSVKANSITEGLDQYAQENNIDLVVIANRQRSFLESVTGQSVTKNMCLTSNTPIMVLHLS